MIELCILHSHPGTALPCEDGKVFVLHTCQRSLYLSFQVDRLAPLKAQLPHAESLRSKEAYAFLLEVLCGLKSKVLAETEVTQQFKLAYAQYLKKNDRDPLLMRLIEKLFKDAKEVRTQHLNHVGQKSYASLAKKILAQKAQDSKLPVLICGSGELAQHLFFHLEKHYPLVVCARNQEKTKALAQRFGGEILEWDKRSLWRNFSLVVNTIGAHEILFGVDAFYFWQQNHPEGSAFIDLGYPSVIQTPLQAEHSVYRLPDVFKLGEEIEEKKHHHLTAAQHLVWGLTEKRMPSLTNPAAFFTREHRFA